MISKELREKIEQCDWDIYDCSDFIELSKYSPAGEDFSFSVTNKSDEETLHEIFEYAQDFDVDEHAKLWHGQNRGEPTSLSDLLEDAKAIKNMIQELYDEIAGNKKEKPYNIEITDDDLSHEQREKIMDMVNEYLSDKYGSCSGGYGYEISIKLTDIDWEEEIND